MLSSGSYGSMRLFRNDEIPMKVYWLKPRDGQPWLTPEEVVARLQSVFPRVRFSAEAARALGYTLETVDGD